MHNASANADVAAAVRDFESAVRDQEAAVAAETAAGRDVFSGFRVRLQHFKEHKAFIMARLPEQNAVAILDPDQPQPILAAPSAPQATDILVSEDGATLYVSHLTGEVSTLDARSGELQARVEISGPGTFTRP